MTGTWLLDPTWRWQRVGGGGIIAIAVLGAVGVLALHLDAVVGQVIAQALLTIVSIVTGWALAFGSTGSNGIVGASTWGKLGILTYSASTLVAVPAALAAPDSPLELATGSASSVGFVGIVIALVQISRQRIADKRSRRAPLWVFLAIVVILFVAVVALLGFHVSGDIAAVVSAVVASLSLSIVGFAYLRNPLVTETAATESALQ